MRRSTRLFPISNASTRPSVFTSYLVKFRSSFFLSPNNAISAIPLKNFRRFPENSSTPPFVSTNKDSLFSAGPLIADAEIFITFLFASYPSTRVSATSSPVMLSRTKILQFLRFLLLSAIYILPRLIFIKARKH